MQPVVRNVKRLVLNVYVHLPGVTCECILRHSTCFRMSGSESVKNLRFLNFAFPCVHSSFQNFSSNLLLNPDQYSQAFLHSVMDHTCFKFFCMHFACQRTNPASSSIQSSSISSVSAPAQSSVAQDLCGISRPSFQPSTAVSHLCDPFVQSVFCTASQLYLFKHVVLIFMQHISLAAQTILRCTDHHDSRFQYSASSIKSQVFCVALLSIASPDLSL